MSDTYMIWIRKIRR